MRHLNRQGVTVNVFGNTCDRRTISVVNVASVTEWGNKIAVSHQKTHKGTYQSGTFLLKYNLENHF